MNWGALIRETYGDIIDSVHYLTEYAQRLLQSEITEDMGEIYI